MLLGMQACRIWEPPVCLTATAPVGYVIKWYAVLVAVSAAVFGPVVVAVVGAVVGAVAGRSPTPITCGGVT